MESIKNTLAYSLAVILALILSTPKTYAQQTPVHPVDPNALLLGTMPVTVIVPDINATTSTNVSLEAFVWLTGSGKTDYVMDARSIQVNGQGSGVNAMSTPQLFSLLAQATVARGVTLGYTPCTSTCSSAPENLTKVYHDNCVTRTGTGPSTHFSWCGSESYGVRNYSVCCPSGSGSPVINLVSWNNSSCSSGCQTTFP